MDMHRLKVFVFTIFSASLAVAVANGPIRVGTSLYLKALLLFGLFSFLYSHLAIAVKIGNVKMDYAISLFAGPFGLLIYEKSTTILEYQSESVTITYTASFGLYFYLANGETDIKHAYIHADDLLIQAKDLGENRVSMENG